MKCVFFHDIYITLDAESMYSSGSLSAEVVNRYLNYYGNLTIVSRYESSRDVETLTYVGSLQDLQFKPMPNLASLSVSNFFSGLRILIRTIQQNDIFIVRLPSLIGFLSGLILLFILGKRKELIVEVVGCPLDTYRNLGTLKGRLLSRPLWFLMRLIVKKSENVLYVTDVLLQKKYPSNGRNLIGCSDVNITVEDKVLAERLTRLRSAEEGKIKMGMIGYLNVSYKGYDLALKALQKVVKVSDVNVTLEIVGGGDSTQLEAMSKSLGLSHCVSFLGTKSFPDGVLSWLDSIDIYLQPSRTEGMPRSLIEAMSRACCCVGSNVGDIGVLLEHDYVHEVDDYETLAEIIIALLDRESRESNVISCFEKVKEYDSDVLSIRRDNFYRSIL